MSIQLCLKCKFDSYRKNLDCLNSDRLQTFEFSLIRSKFSKKYLPAVKIELGITDELTLLVRLSLLRSLCSHILLILAKSYKSKYQLVHQQK